MYKYHCTVAAHGRFLMITDDEQLGTINNATACWPCLTVVGMPSGPVKLHVTPLSSATYTYDAYMLSSVS